MRLAIFLEYVVWQAEKAKRIAYDLRVKANLDELLFCDPDQYEGGRHRYAESVDFYEREH